jgi:hypothetical protein
MATFGLLDRNDETIDLPVDCVRNKYLRLLRSESWNPDIMVSAQHPPDRLTAKQKIKETYH